MTPVAIHCRTDAVGCWIARLLEGFMQSHRPYFVGRMMIAIHLMLEQVFAQVAHACDDAALTDILLVVIAYIRT